ncbi:uncharacterized protein B0J16DRAFT_45538 [Fusarium flagelliforme]|uniref:uncharacterized protein n=1 Tax=Fusarium flagelliforme TaxID=2675880 RepID=UPI001E8D781A|nr:uncharacterized protein B0J16DRAFT_45538 [Fusarium flagelliforme]KAH7198812.1 hypothetical protein B0J16DRAFT_45538 [Fusarium flagelliforme]
MTSLVTGTPMASSLRDVFSPLTLIAYANKAICNLKGLSSDVVGYVPGLYDESYDAYKLDNEIIDEAGQTLGTTKGIFCETFLETLKKDQLNKPCLLAPLKKLESQSQIEPTGSKAWMLSPDLLQACSTDLRWTTILGARVVKPILKVFNSRRSMNRALTLPDSTVTYPSTGMLPIEIIVEECPFDEDDPDFEMVKTIGKQYAENLSA